VFFSRYVISSHPVCKKSLSLEVKISTFVLRGRDMSTIVTDVENLTFIDQTVFRESLVSNVPNR
jgi:hypothetical protein